MGYLTVSDGTDRWEVRHPGRLLGTSLPAHHVHVHFRTKDIVQFSPAQLALKQDELVTARRAFKQKYGINQKPSNLVMSVLMPTR